MTSKFCNDNCVRLYSSFGIHDAEAKSLKSPFLCHPTSVLVIELALECWCCHWHNHRQANLRRLGFCGSQLSRMMCRTVFKEPSKEKNRVVFGVASKSVVILLFDGQEVAVPRLWGNIRKI